MAKVLLVTGGGRGIGAATARLAAAAGHDVAVNYLRDEIAASALVKEISSQGRKAIAVQGDVAAEAEVVRMFEEIDRKLGRLTALRSEEHTSKLQSQSNLVCRLLLEKKKKIKEPG